jgi:hypothetical protein
VAGTVGRGCALSGAKLAAGRTSRRPSPYGSCPMPGRWSFIGTVELLGLVADKAGLHGPF